MLKLKRKHYWYGFGALAIVVIALMAAFSWQQNAVRKPTAADIRALKETTQAAAPFKASCADGDKACEVWREFRATRP
jgi:hypothetical protein